MLGNFSFGDYFKAGAIPMAWGLLTDVFGLDGERLWVTVHTDDDEAAEIWRGRVGVPANRIQRMGEDNFWEMGDTGPCGPSSEIYFDRGPAWGAEGGPGGGGGEERFVEIWNLVFMQFDRQQDGSLRELPKPNIDTGAGLERILMTLQDVPAVWDTDVLRPVIAEAERLTGRRYGEDAETDVALRILADHARSMTFLIGDGVFPSNEDRGYVLRRLIRRAVRHAYALGVERAVAPDLVAACVTVMGEAYPESAEEPRLHLGRGRPGRGPLSRHASLRPRACSKSELAGGSEQVSGEVAFRLHDTHGFPVELTREIASGARGGRGRGRLRGRDGPSEGDVQAGRDGARRPTRRSCSTCTVRWSRNMGPTRFVGYTEETATSTVLAAAQREDGQLEIFLDLTPFYAEGGGQVGDTGVIETDTGRARVIDTTFALPGLIRHLAVPGGGRDPSRTGGGGRDRLRTACRDPA